jgi:hypothetical protein
MTTKKPVVSAPCFPAWYGGSMHTDMSLALPTLLWHSAQIAGGAAVMSVVGGLLIYGTIMSFTLFFQEEQEF